MTKVTDAHMFIKGLAHNKLNPTTLDPVFVNLDNVNQIIYRGSVMVASEWRNAYDVFYKDRPSSSKVFDLDAEFVASINPKIVKYDNPT